MSPEGSTAAGERPTPGDAPPPLRPSDSFGDAARAAMWPQVARMLELEPALREPDPGEDLKRYRVATRRLRAALRVFGDALPKRALRDVAPELAELARAVGRTRDLDVRISSLPAGAGIQPLRDAWAAERAEAAAEVTQRLETKRHGRLIADLVQLVAADPDGGHGSSGHAVRGRRSVRDRAGSAIWAGFERLRADATEIGGADLIALHDLRIRAKRLRYTLEFLAPVLGADREWLVARLVALQDHLGALHDADLAAAAARAFVAGETEHGAGPLTDEQRSAIEAYASGAEIARDDLRRDVRMVADPVAGPAFARRLSRAILGPDDAGTAAARS